MTNQEQIIAPSLELVHQWADMLSSRSDHAVFSLATQWGADQELEACLHWMGNGSRENLSQVIGLRNARRPKPPSLTEQALRELGDIYNDEKIDGHAYNTIRSALEALPNDH